MRGHPHLFEANARVFLRRLSDKHQRPLTLSTVPEEEWKVLARRGFDLVWLMGVWRRSPGARDRALAVPDLRRAYDEALPGWNDDDVGGSPYAIHAYALDPALGAEGELAELKARLNRLGLGLMLDFVANHLAYDHDWVQSHPGRFLRGSVQDAAAHPEWFFTPGAGAYLAHGRDPNFPSWTDTVQVDFFSEDLRQALAGEAERIAEVSDGVRCDMAMLALNRVFEGVWGGILRDAPRPAEEFWPGILKAARAKRPGFLFLAEAYWGLEWELQQLGFNFTYDKTLYDRLRHSSPPDIRGHLQAEDLYQRRSARFIENHDEPRAAEAFGRERSMAAAIVAATTPGLRFFHDGQLEGRRTRLPVQLVREPAEPADPGLSAFYERLLASVHAPAFHGGEWVLIEAARAGEGNESHGSLLAWTWRQAKRLKVVVVNYSGAPAQGRLRVPLPFEAGDKVAFTDELSGEVYERDAAELKSQGLFVDLGPWRAHLLDAS